MRECPLTTIDQRVGVVKKCRESRCAWWDLEFERCGAVTICWPLVEKLERMADLLSSALTDTKHQQQPDINVYTDGRH